MIETSKTTFPASHINIDNFDKHTDHSKLTKSAGNVVLATVVDLDSEPQVHPIVLDGINYTTDMPESVTVLDPESNHFSIIPSSLDRLEPDTYHIFGDVPDLEAGLEDEFADPPTKHGVAKKVVVTQEGNDKRVDIESFGKFLPQDQWDRSPHSDAVMVRLGFELDEDRPGYFKSIPTPDTVKRRASELGVDINLIEAGEIEAQEYLEMFANGVYPVAVGSEEYYQHDIRDDHLPAYIYGGELAKVAIANYSQAALSSGGQINLEDAAANVDKFTNVLGACVYEEGGSSIGEAFSDRHFMDTFYITAEQIGLSEKDAKQLIVSAAKRAQELGAKARGVLLEK